MAFVKLGCQEMSPKMLVSSLWMTEPGYFTLTEHPNSGSAHCTLC